MTRRRILLGLFIAVALLMMVVGALVYWLAATESGLRWCVRQANSMSAGAISIESARGRLIGPLAVQGLKVRTEAVAIELKAAELDWRPRALLVRRLAIGDAKARDLHVTLGPSQGDDRGGSAALPLAVSVDSFTLKRLTVTHPAVQDVQFDQIDLTALELANDLLWRKLTARGPGLHLEAEGGLRRATGPGSGWDLSWSLLATDLSRISPAFRGRVTAKGSLEGPARTPHVQAEIDAVDLALGERRLSRARAQIDVDMHGETPWRINVTGDDLRLRPEYVVHRLSLSGRGNIENHDLSLAAALPDGDLRLHANGRLSESGWQGQVSRGRFASERFGDWRQEDSSPLSAGDRKVDLGTTCWTDGTSRACATARWRRDEASSFQASITALPVARLPFLQTYPGADISGSIKGAAEVTIDKGRITSINANAVAGPGKIRYTLADTEHITAYRQARADIIGDGTDLNAELELALETQDNATGQIHLPDWQEHLSAPGEQRFEGSARFAWSDFGLVSVLLPAVVSPQAQLSGDITIGGNLSAPRFSGTAVVTAGGFELPRYGLAVKDLNLALEAPTPSALSVRGSARSGEGRVDVVGRFAMEEPLRWNGNVTIKGDNFEVMSVAGRHVVVSPDLRLALAPRSIDLKGNISVPQAELKLLQRQEEVRLSRDVIVLGQTPSPAPEPPWKISSQLAVHLGDDVHVEGYGFDGRLAGTLTVSEPATGPALADGEIRVLKGTYQAYGRTLTIEDGGRLFYAGGPLADPGLDLRAVRTADKVKVGLLVRGRLQAPQLSLYSDSPMTDSDMLSYLVLGRPYSAASAAQGALLYKAASTLGGSQSGGLLQNIVQRFGLSDVRLESGASYEDTVIAVEKYLSPRLYLRYAVGLWDGAGGLRLRYKLSDKWTVEGSSGHLGGADILYTRER